MGQISYGDLLFNSFIGNVTFRIENAKWCKTSNQKLISIQDPSRSPNTKIMSIRSILFVMFMLTNSMNILASRASSPQIEENQLNISKHCLLIQSHYQIENNTCPSITATFMQADLEFYNKFCDFEYIQKQEKYPLLRKIFVLFCVIGIIMSNPVYPFVKFSTPTYDRP